MFPSPHWLRPGRLTRSAGQTSQAPWASIQGVLMVTSLLSHPSGLQWLHFPNFSVSTRYSHRHQSSCCLAGDELAAVMHISIVWQVVSCVRGQTKQRRSTPVLSLQVPSPPFLTAVPLKLSNSDLSFRSQFFLFLSFFFVFSSSHILAIFFPFCPPSCLPLFTTTSALYTFQLINHA
ncbi:unnamed protein product [Larinioides sclopetarius]|uniref:Uncharacterized protein n=2 Tax=Larinioides sclopetarius TaxID=280406 RepID=A0AAV2BJG7_9ARAC